MAAGITVEQHIHSTAGGELAEVFAEIASACHKIADKIRLAGLDDIYGAAGATNIQGEQQQKLDLFANEVLTHGLRRCASVAGVVSEEDDEPVSFGRADAPFLLAFDPLDGSSNIDVNVNVGTIFSIQRADHAITSEDLLPTALKPGSKMAGAGYVLYGPSTVMVTSTGSGVASYTLDKSGTFLLTADHMHMPDQGPYYSANEANVGSWPVGFREFLVRLQSGTVGPKPYSSRYIGSLVADFHRTLLKGGIFLYPPTDKTPHGKLRLLYEANPLAFIAVQAGGAATNGEKRILDLVAGQIHQRTPLAIGSRTEVELLQRIQAGVKA